MTYESGLAVAFFIWLTQAILLLIAINSTFSRNLRKIGQRISWTLNRPKRIEQPELPKTAIGKAAKFLFIQAVGLAFVLLSWVYVAFFAISFIYMRIKDAGKPQSIKELQWKMRNIEMSFEQITAEMAKAQCMSEEELMQLRHELAPNEEHQL